MVPSGGRWLARWLRQRQFGPGSQHGPRFRAALVVVVLAVHAVTGAAIPAVGAASDDAGTPADRAGVVDTAGILEGTGGTLGGTGAALDGTGAAFDGTAAALDGNGPTPVLVTVEDGPNYLDLGAPAVRRSGTGEVGLDVATAVRTDSERLHGSFARRSAERALAGVHNETRRDRIVENRTERLERRRANIERANRQTIRGFVNGSISPRAFLQRRAAIAAAATRTGQSATRVKSLANAPAGYDTPLALEVRLDAVRSIDLYRGSVGNWTQRAATGGAPWSRIYVETSADGYTTALVSGNEFRRETFAGSEYDPGGTDQFAESDQSRISAAITRWSELYPWVSTSPQTHVAFGSTGIYRHSAEFADGELTVYLDGATRNPFRESRRQQADAVLRRETVRSTGGAPTLTLNRTYETGPARLQVRDENGTRTNATVAVGDQFETATGGNGRLTFVEPRRPYTVNATLDDGRNTVLTVTDG